MKHRILFLITLFFLNHWLFADMRLNSAPDYDKIKIAISQPNTPLYYPTLFERLKKFDTSLTEEEFKHLYYGYIYHPNYDPYGMKKPLAERKEKQEKLKTYLSQKIQPNEYINALKTAHAALNDFPFDDNALRILLRSYGLMGDKINADKASFIFNTLMKTILKSGNGADCKNGFHVIIIGHEYFILDLLKQKVKQQSLIGNCDYLEIAPGSKEFLFNGKPREGYYFNIEKMKESSLEIIKTSLK